MRRDIGVLHGEDGPAEVCRRCVPRMRGGSGRQGGCRDLGASPPTRSSRAQGDGRRHASGRRIRGDLGGADSLVRPPRCLRSSSPLRSRPGRSSSPPVAHQVEDDDERGDQAQEHRKRQHADAGRRVGISEQGNKSPHHQRVERDTASNAHNTGRHATNVEQKGKRPDRDRDGTEWARGALDCSPEINEEEEHRHNRDAYAGERETDVPRCRHLPGVVVLVVSTHEQCRHGLAPVQ